MGPHLAERIASFYQCLDRVFDPIWMPIVGEASHNPTKNPGPMFHFSKENAPGVGGDLASVEADHDIPSVQILISELCSRTLCGNMIACYLLVTLLLE